jgi:hypothetical protein
MSEVYQDMLDRLCLLILGCYLLLNAGFMQVRILPFFPVAEFFILCYGLTINYCKVYHSLKQEILIWPFVFWWTLAFFNAIIGFAQHGIWAFRDASNAVESSFILIGFVFAQREKNIQLLFKYLPCFLVVAVIYAFSAPLGTYLRQFSFVIMSYNKAPVPILFIYVNSAMLLITVCVYIGLSSEKLNRRSILLFMVATVLMWFAIFWYQKRTIYLQVVSLLGFFFFFDKKMLWRTLMLLCATVVFANFVDYVCYNLQGSSGQPMLSQGSSGQPMLSQGSSGQPMLSQGSSGQPMLSQGSLGQPMLSQGSSGHSVFLRGAAGQPMTFSFILDHLKTLTAFSKGSKAKYSHMSHMLGSAAGGINQRLTWWSTSARKIFSQWQYALFGLGYGVPLTSFHIANGIVVREVHNTFLSVLLRTGLIGFTLWISIHFILSKYIWKSCKSGAFAWENNNRKIVLWMMSFCLLVLIWGIGEDSLTKPYNAVPYYFFWGVALAIARKKHLSNKQVESESPASS